MFGGAVNMTGVANCPISIPGIWRVRVVRFICLVLRMRAAPAEPVCLLGELGGYRLPSNDTLQKDLL